MNVATGNKYQREVDIASVGDGSLEFVRVYNSASDRYLNVGLGPAWTHSWARQVISLPSRTDPSTNAFTPGRTSVFRPDGKILVYTQSSSGGPWLSTADVNDQLIQTASGWKYITADNLTEIYSTVGGASPQFAAANLVSVTSASGKTTTLTYGNADRTSPDYVPVGLLATVSDFRGRTLQFRYDATTGRISKVIDPSGAAYLYTYEDSTTANFPRLKAVTYPGDAANPATTRTYVYNEAANIDSQSNQIAALTGIVDESQVRFATYRYGPGAKAISSEHAGGVDKFSFDYSTPGTTKFVDPIGTTYSSPITFIGNLGQVTGLTSCPGCNNNSYTSSYKFDSANRRTVTAATDNNGNLTCYTYDSGGRNLEATRIEGLAPGPNAGDPCPGSTSTTATRTISTGWNTTWRLPTKIAEPLRITTYAYQGDPGVASCAATTAPVLCSKTIQATSDTTGASGFSATATSDLPRTWAYSYNAAGQLISVDGPRTDVTDVTTYSYYTANDAPGAHAIGDLKSVTNALGQVTTFDAYDGMGRLLQSTDPNGLQTVMEYFPRGWLKSKELRGAGLSEKTTYDYTPYGSLKSVTAPDGSYIQYVFDDAHRVTDVYDSTPPGSAGDRIHYGLDNYGNRTSEETYGPGNALARRFGRTFDVLNRLHTEVGGTPVPANSTNYPTTTYDYDPNGNRKSITDPLSHTTLQSFDALNRLKSIQDPVNGSTALTIFGYDGLDQLSSVTDPTGLTTTYGINGLGDNKSVVSPDTGTANSTFDTAGNLKTRTDARGVTATYTYDPLNRVAQISYSNGSTTYPDETVTYTYDSCAFGVGRVCNVADKSGSTQFAYDVTGRVTSKTHSVASKSLTMIYAYDAYGRLKSITTPSGQVVRYTYVNGRPDSVSLNGVNILSNGTYAPFGPITDWTWGNSTSSVPNTHHRGLDLDYRVSRVTSSLPATGSQPAFDFVTGWDLASRVASLQDVSGRLGTTTYGYDDLNRLASAINGSATNLGYTYNGVGDRATSTASGASTTYTYFPGTHRLQSLTGAQSKSFSFDAAGNTTSSGSQTWTYAPTNRAASAGTTTFDVNALGQRVRKSTGTNVTRFVYDEAGHLWGEYDDAGHLINETVWLGDLPVAMVRP